MLRPDIGDVTGMSGVTIPNGPKISGIALQSTWQWKSPIDGGLHGEIIYIDVFFSIAIFDYQMVL